MLLLIFFYIAVEYIKKISRIKILIINLHIKKIENYNIKQSTNNKSYATISTVIFQGKHDTLRYSG